MVEVGKLLDRADLGDALYKNKILNASPIAYWMLNDPVGTAAADETENNPDGDAVDVTFQTAGIGDGQFSGNFNGASSYVDVGKAPFISDFDGGEGSLILWIRITDPAEWTSTRRIVRFDGSAGTNYIDIYSIVAGLRVDVVLNGTTYTQTLASPTFDEWLCVGLTWGDVFASSPEIVLYINGGLYSSVATIHNWTGGNLASAYVGASPPTTFWRGDIAHVAVWDSILDSDTMMELSRVPTGDREFTRVFYDVFMGQQTLGVIPYAGDEYAIQSFGTGTRNLVIGSGAASVVGYTHQTNSDETLSFDSVPANNRIDRIVLRVDWQAQTVRLAVKKGVAAVNPSPPALDLLYGVLYEVPLWQVYLPTGYTTILEENLFDERVFIKSPAYGPHLHPENLVHNSEFMAWSGLITGAPVTEAPEWWDQYDAVNTATLSSVAVLGNQTRGRAVQCVTGATNQRGIKTVVPADIPEGVVQVPPGGGNTYVTYTIRFQLYITSGAVTVDIDHDYLAFSSTLETRVFRRTGQTLDCIIRVRLPYADLYTGPENHYLTLNFYSDAIASTFTVGQVICVPGHNPGPYREQRDIILFDRGITDGAWNGTTKSTGTTAIDLTASYGGHILTGTRAVQLRMTAEDSGSLGATGLSRAQISASGTQGPGGGGSVHVGGAPNNRTRERSVWVAVDQTLRHTGAGGPGYSVFVEATGAGTLTATVIITGIEI